MNYFDEAEILIDKIRKLEQEQATAIGTRKRLEDMVASYRKEIKNDKEALDIVTHAIEILREVSDEAVRESYQFIEKNLNPALERMFRGTTRRIRLKEYTRANQYPQLELELQVGNGKTRSLKSDSGHGLAQIVSLLSILALIVITGARRILVMDEIISGLSDKNMEVVSDILWTFTEIGFQFIINDHGYIPKGAKVYHLQMEGNVSRVINEYIEDSGVYRSKQSEDSEYEDTETSIVYSNHSDIEQEDVVAL